MADLFAAQETSEEKKNTESNKNETAEPLQRDTTQLDCKEDNNDKNVVFDKLKPSYNQMSYYKTKTAKTDSGGATGQLYESKLISLILYRLLKDDKVKEFLMASNLDGVGTMDDICIRLNHADSEKPLLILIQAKHRSGPEKGITDTDLYQYKGDFNLKDNFSSLIEVLMKFKENKEKLKNEKEKIDAMFAGEIDNVIPYFIFYTPAVNKMTDKRITKSPDGISIVKDLINTGCGGVFQINYNKNDIDNVAVIDNTAKKNNESTDDKTINGLLDTECGRIDYFNLLYNVTDYPESENDNDVTEATNTNNKNSIDNATDDSKDKKNTDSTTQDNNIKKTKKNKQKKDLVTFLLDIKENGETDDSQMRKYAEYFFQNMYFFADQSTEDEVSTELQNEIGNHQVFKGTTTEFRLKPDALFLNFHYKVQNWWMMAGNVYYLTKKCEYLDKTMKEVFDKTYLSILNYNCINYLDLYPVQFNCASMKQRKTLLQKLKYEEIGPRKILRINSNSIIFTCLKLKQYFTQQVKDIKFSYVDFGYVSKIKDVEFNMLLEEMKNSDVEILVTVRDTSVNVNDKMYEIIKAFDKKTPPNKTKNNKSIVIVTKESQTIDTQNFNIDIENDYISGLPDIVNQKEILEHIITIQGVELSLNQIIYDKMKYFINADILLQILKHEKIYLGRSLSQNYDDQFYLKRRLLKTNISELDTLKDIDDSVVVVTAEPGMGKSTLLSALAMKTKSLHPSTWIARINLQDYSKDFFYRWQENKTAIDLRESMLLVCKAELKTNMYNKVDIKLSKGCLELIDLGLDSTSLFLLRMIAHSYNEGYIIYLLDGFDEICPNYEMETVEFIKNLVPINIDASGPVDDVTALSLTPIAIRHKVWITSRPYDSVKRTLEKFTSPFSIASMSRDEQLQYYEKYFRDHIHNEYNINTVKEFMNFMSQKHRSEVTLSSIPLRVMYKAAWDYFKSKGEMDALSFIHDTDIAKQYGNNEKYEQALHLAGIPLHMKIYANHFVNVIQDESEYSDKWDLDVHTFKFYESFLETKLRQIFFEDKKRKNIYLADIRTRYDEDKEKFSKKHKRLAFYSFFHETPNRDIKCMDIEKIDVMIKKIRNGEEKTGLIYGMSLVSDRHVPMFVHLAFAEYFAVEHISDILKKYTILPRNIVNFIINWLLDSHVGLLAVFEQKLKNDVKIAKILSNDTNKKTIFNVMERQFGSKKNTFEKALNNGLKMTVEILIRSVEGKLDKTKLKSFVEYIGGNFFIYSALFNYDDLIMYVVRKIREVDAEMVNNISDIIMYDIMTSQISSKDLIINRLNDVGIKIDNNVMLYSGNVENYAQ